MHDQDRSTPRKRTNITKILAEINQSKVNFDRLYKGLSAFKTLSISVFQTERFPKWVKMMYLLEI